MKAARLLPFLALAFSLAAAAPASPTLAETEAWLRSKNALPEGAKAETLEALILPSRGLTDADLRFLEPLCPLGKLKTLDFRGNDLSGAGFAALRKQCPRFAGIRNLDLYDNLRFEDAAIALLDQFPDLESINLDDEPRITGVGFKGMAARLPKLRELWLVRCPLTADGLRSIAGLTTLRSLNLSGVRLGNRELPLLPRALTTLNVGYTDVDDDGLRLLAGTFELESLALAATKVTFAGLTGVLPAMKRLRDIDLSALRLGKQVAALAALLERTTITSLTLRTSGLKTADLLPFAAVPGLERLGVYDFLGGTGGEANAIHPRDLGPFHERRRALKLPPIRID